ncbi:unnamed protein product, partial [Iphiclides podalirius]
MVKEDIDRIEKRVVTWEEHIKDLEQGIVAPSSGTDASLKHETSELRIELKKLSTKFDELDQASRSCNIVEVQNIPEKKTENLIHLSMEIGKQIGVYFKKSNIRSVHRPKNIVLQLTTRRLRDDVIAAARARRSLLTAQLLCSPNSAAAAAQSTRFYKRALNT